MYDPRSDPQNLSQQLLNIKLTPEEKKVWEDCMRGEAIWAGGIITSLYTGGLGYLATSYIQPKYSKWAGLGLGVMGFLVGRMAYGNKCLRKVMELPNSSLREQLEQLKQGAGLPQRHGIEPPPPTGEITDRSSQFGIDSTSPIADFDSYTPTDSFDGFSRTYDDDRTPDEMDLTEPIGSRHNLTYEELRQKNREEYYKQKPNVDRHQPSHHPRYKAYEPAPVIEPSSSPSLSPSPRGVEKTKYGDVWG